MQKTTCPSCKQMVPDAQFCFRCSAPLPQVKPQQGNKGWRNNVSWQGNAVVILGAILITVSLAAAVKQLREAANARPVVAKPDFSNPERLNVSEPTFSTSGIRFTLNDKRPNKALWVSIKIGSSGPSTDLMSWFSSSGVRPGELSMSFREFKYMDSGIDALMKSTQCEMIIGAKLESSDKIVYTNYSVPISEMRRALLKSFK